MVDVIDLYMENFYEGKNDNPLFSVSLHHKKKALPRKAVASARRKIGYSKAAKRMAQLRDTDSYIPAPEDYMVVQGMLRSHQLPMKDYSSKFSISDKRRMDTAYQKLEKFRVSA